METRIRRSERSPDYAVNKGTSRDLNKGIHSLWMGRQTYKASRARFMRLAADCGRGNGNGYVLKCLPSALDSASQG